MKMKKETMIDKYLDLDIEIKKLTKIKDELKSKLIEDLGDGIHETKKGYVNIHLDTTTSFDKKRLLEEHPEINEEEYTKKGTTIRVTTKVNVI